MLFFRYPDEIQSTKIIGERQFQKAVELFNSANETLTGKIDYRHVYVNFTNIDVELNGTTVKTCPAALGPGFAAGTTDGPGVFGFQQGDTEVRKSLTKLLENERSACCRIVVQVMKFDDSRSMSCGRS